MYSGKIDVGSAPQPPTSKEFILWVHKEFCQQLPAELLVVKDPQSGKEEKVVPGELRKIDVKVGHHIAPAPEDLARPCLNALPPLTAMRSYPRISASLGWRLRTTGCCGFTRSQMATDVWHGCSPTHSSRSSVSAPASGRSRVAWHAQSIGTKRRCKPPMSLGVAISTDEATDPGWPSLLLHVLSNKLCRPSGLHGVAIRANRTSATHGDLVRGGNPRRPLAEGKLSRCSAKPCLPGEFTRGKAPELTGYQERQARTVLNTLIEKGFLVSPTSRSAVRLGFPIAVVDRWFPRLYTGPAVAA